MTDFSPDYWSLPLQGRKEREHLYRWISEEEAYVAGKFDDQRDGHDASLAMTGLDDFWSRQIVQYLDRAQMFLVGALEAAQAGKDEREVRHLEQRAQQAMAKCMMTTKGLVESSIRVFGDLPKPGVPSGDVQDWKKAKPPASPEIPFCYYGSHPGQSCLAPDEYHMVFSRILSDQEWTLLASRIDSTWDGEHYTWDPEKVTSLIHQIAPDVECSFYEGKNP